MSVFKKFFAYPVLLSINSIAIVCLLISYLAKYIDPADYWLIGFFGLCYPVFLIANIAFIVFWLSFKKKLFLLSTLAIAIGYNSFFKTINFNLHDKNPENSFSISSYNVRAFDLNGPHFTKEPGMKAFAYLRENPSDIYCFQEFFNTINFQFSPFDSVKKSTALQYQHVEYSVLFRGNKFGLATFSKFPIVNKGIIDFEKAGTNFCIYTDLKIENQIVRVYNMHLASIHISGSDYEFMEELNPNMDGAKFKKGVFAIARRIKHGFKVRSYQAQKVVEHIKDSPYPVIVCSDINDTPYSFSYQLFNSFLHDAFRKKGNGIGATYNGKIPALRIDYIFFDKAINVHAFAVHKPNISDHFPLRAIFSLNKDTE